VSRILLHAQHLSGVGHHVRIDLLARGLARRHEVWVVDGGEPVPRRPPAVEIRRVPLPRIRRTGETIVPLAAAPGEGAGPAAAGGAARPPAGELDAILGARVRALAAAVERIRPDALVVEHFPFSKWELRDEILGAIDAARAAGARIVCSIRDIVRRTRFDPGDERAHAARVLAALDTRFDLLLVHSDPRFCRLDETFARAGEIRIPVIHTGFVSEKPAGAAGARQCPPGDRASGSEAGDPRRAARAGAPPPPLRPRDRRACAHPGRPAGSDAPEGMVVASTGGGTEGLALARAVLLGFRLLHDELPGLALTLFTGLRFAPEEVARLRAEARGLPVAIEPFGPDFLTRLAASELSVSRAGYNTCANLLETGARAVLVPSGARSDQRLRAARMKALGLAEVLEDDPPAPEAIAAAARGALPHPRPTCDLDLEGVERSCDALGELVGGGRGARG
jgi:predicted glycosyltransferase